MTNQHFILRSVGVRSGLFLLLALLVSFRVRAGDVASLPARADIRFAATSTLHDFGGSLTAMPFVLQLSNGLWSAAADVPGGRMATGNDGRDRNLYKMIDTNTYPNLHGQVTGGFIPVKDASTNATLVMTIRGATSNVPVVISSWRETTQEIRFHASWTLSLKRFALKPPSVMGVIRVGDAVRIEADVTATRTNSVPAAPAGKVSP